jgi:hypothetical protein
MILLPVKKETTFAISLFEIVHLTDQLSNFRTIQDSITKDWI